MDILFITPTDKLKLNCVSNGTMLLGTKLLQAGFSVDIVRFGQFDSYMNEYELFISQITNHILEINPKCISFYTLWPYYHISLRIANEIKQRNQEIIVVFGGPQSSATAVETMKTFSFVDYICTGEGENTVVPFFTEILRNQDSDLASIPGLCYRQGDEIIRNMQDVSLCNLNELPHWSDQLINTWDPSEEEDLHSDYYFMPIDAGRGCPYSCTFCSTSNFWRRTYRLKSAERIVEDIRYYYNKYGITSFGFSHDAFTSNIKLVTEVCDKLIQENLNITWCCSTRIDCLTEELVQKMVQTGLKAINVGIETGSPRMQKVINKRLNLERAKQMVSVLQENNLSVSLYFMYGFPEETEEDLNQTLELLFDFLDQGVGRATMSFCHFSPGTQMTIDNLDKLVFEKDYRIISRGVFGYREEFSMLQSNKTIFSTLYNLRTELRDKYQNMFYFKYIYDKYRSPMHFLRKYFRGDNLAMFRVFNPHIVEFLSQDKITPDMIQDGIFEIANKSIDDFDKPFAKQIKALFAFERDVKEIRSMKMDCSIRKLYDFSYLDYLEQIPIEDFTEYKTEFLIQRKDGIFSVEMLNMQPFSES